VLSRPKLPPCVTSARTVPQLGCWGGNALPIKPHMGVAPKAVALVAEPAQPCKHWLH